MSRTTNKNSPINSKQPFLVEISPVAQGTAGLNHHWWGNRFHLWQGWAWRLSCQPGIIYSEQSWSKGTLEILVWENKFLHPRDMHRAQYLGQNRISRVRWLGIHSLHTGQKNKTKTKKPRGESNPKCQLPALMGQGAAGLLWEPWKKANYCGLSQCYLTFLAGELNPDTATVQLWKQHQFILLMPSSLQYLLMKAELVCLDNGPHLLGKCSHWQWKSTFFSSSICFARPKAKTSLVREAISLFSYDIWSVQGKFHQNLPIFLPLPGNTRSSWSNRNSGVSSRPLSSHCL